MPRNEAEYYRKRARQERAMAFGAKDPSARLAHLSLAEQYQRIADGSLVRVKIADPGETDQALPSGGTIVRI